MLWDLFLRLILSGILAGLIGLERELRSKEAGLKTHFLVGIGSALAMIVSKYAFYDILAVKGVSLDPSRIAAQVVSGISFLGAGTIIFEKHYIRGLTTAAGIWATASIGLALGAGMYEIGIFSTVLVLVGLEILNRLFKNTFNKYIEINVTTKSPRLSSINEAIDISNFSIVEYKSKRTSYENIEDAFLIKLKLKAAQKEDPYDLINKLYENKDTLKVDIIQ